MQLVPHLIHQAEARPELVLIQNQDVDTHPSVIVVVPNYLPSLPKVKDVIALSDYPTRLPQ